MRHCADQPASGPPRQPRVGVQSNDVADAGRHCRCSTARWQESGVGGTAQQAIQFMKLSTFAFPADPLALAVIPTAPTVEKEKSLASIWGESMTAVQLLDTVDDRGQQFVVSRHIFVRRICPVGEQREAKVAIWIRQIMHFQTLDLLRNLSVA